MMFKVEFGEDPYYDLYHPLIVKSQILEAKCCANSIMILDFLKNSLLSWDGKITPQKSWMSTYPVYVAVYSHAIEEFGKALYLDSQKDVEIMDIDMNIFKDHREKITLAKNYLDKHYSNDELTQFKELKFDVDNKYEVDFDLRLNILQTDIDNGNGEDNLKIALISKNEFRTKTLKLKEIFFNFESSRKQSCKKRLFRYNICFCLF